MVAARVGGTLQSMPPLDSAARRALRARAHHLHPVVAVGQQGLTPAVLKEIDVALRAHELIKVRVFGDDRMAREALLDAICATLDAAPVQHLGKLLVVWRPNPEGAKPRERPRKPRPAAKSGTQARKPGPKTRKPGPKSRTPGGKVRTSAPRSGAPGTGPRAGRPRADAAMDEPTGSSRRRRGQAGEARTAPPAGVPRAALPRRRRTRG